MMECDFIDLCRKGDEEALTELFDRYGTMIQKIAYRITRDRELQKEVFQDTAERIVRSIRGFDSRSSLSTWIYRIAVNTALSLAIKERKLKSTWKSWNDELAPEGMAPEKANEYESNDRICQIRMLSTTLPFRYQEIMSLFYDAELNLQEIADRTKMSTSAIKAILFKARKKLIQKAKKKGLLS
jgi:RNA polymerase sigma-70 factor, ECF subfamily